MWISCIVQTNLALCAKKDPKFSVSRREVYSSLTQLSHSERTWLAGQTFSSNHLETQYFSFSFSHSLRWDFLVYVAKCGSWTHQETELQAGSLSLGLEKGAGGKNDLAEHGGFLGQWNYSEWYESGYMSLHICQNSRTIEHQEWTPMAPMNFSW